MLNSTEHEISTSHKTKIKANKALTSFKPLRCCCINSSLVLVQPRKTRPFITEKLLLGRKESNQTKQTKLSDVVSIMLINVKKPTIVGILTFMSRITFVCSWVEHGKGFITSGPCCFIPLFHTGHESPESPRIDFFLIRGDSWGFIIFFSNRDELRVIPDSLRIFGAIGSIRLEPRKNSLRLENNIRTCCTKVKESISNQLRICRMQHELGTN